MATEGPFEKGNEFDSYFHFKNIFQIFKQEKGFETFIRNSSRLKTKSSSGIIYDDKLYYETLHLMCSPYGGEKRARGKDIRYKEYNLI